MSFKKSHGNMYDWVTHMHTHLGGECPHQCSYCYVGRGRWGRADKYKGELRLLEHELKVDYGTGNTIFIEHMSDMFAEDVRDEWIRDIFAHCNQYKNTYVFQTKNPNRAYEFIDYFPQKFLMGTTIETNRDIQISKAPRPMERFLAIRQFQFGKRADIFITIEPIMDFDVIPLTEWIFRTRPLFVNIGADSKNSNLTEPSTEKVKELIKRLQEKNIFIRKKNNLQRLIGRYGRGNGHTNNS